VSRLASSIARIAAIFVACALLIREFAIVEDRDSNGLLSIEGKLGL